MSINYVQYTALCELVYEKYAMGQTPREDWLRLIDSAQKEHADWVMPPPPPPSWTFVPTAPPPPPPANPPRAAVVTNQGERPDIVVDENMERVVRDVLAWWGTRFCVFQAGGRLLEVQTDGGIDIPFLVRDLDGARMVPVNPARARALASRECNFVKEKSSKDGKQEIISILAPEWLGSAITTRVDFPGIPVFAALAQAPTLRRDGGLIHEPGYDPSTGICLTKEIKLSIPENPSHADAQVAANKLLDLLCDFEFTNPAAKSVWLAALLSATCRHTYNGPTPLFIFDASKRGAGKTRLADMISAIATGFTSPRMIYSSDTSEMDKRIVSLGMSGSQIVLIDNIVGKLASPPLDAALTGNTYTSRVLGKSLMAENIPMKIVWFATGNGMIIGADTARRSLLARIEPTVEHPEQRSGPTPDTPWKYELPKYCFDNRPELLGYALTIVSAYVRAGRPKMNLEKASLEMGSFEEWSKTIRSAVVWAGALDPCETIKDVQATDLDEMALRTMVECWPAEEGTTVTAADLIKRAEVMFGETSPAKEQWRNALLCWLPPRPGNQLPTTRDLGYALRNIKGAIIGNFKIETNNVPVREGLLWKKTRIAADIINFEEKQLAREEKQLARDQKLSPSSPQKTQT